MPGHFKGCFYDKTRILLNRLEETIKMNKHIVRKWDKNKKLLKNHFTEDYKFYRSWNCEYKNIVEAVVKYIINDEDDSYDYEEMAVIDDGDYQGRLFIFPRKTYQPSPNDYLVTYEYYGSCSGCDTLQALQMESGEELISGLMDMSLHLIQNMEFIYGEEE